MFFKVLIIVLELLYFKTAACRAPVTAEHLLMAAPIFIPLVPFSTSSHASSCLYVFSVQVGYNPLPEGHFSFGKKVAKSFFRCHLVKKKSCPEDKDDRMLHCISI